jgi:hypothetical protein
MTRATVFLIIAMIALAAIAASEHARPNSGAPLVNADYQRCLTICPAPLIKQRIEITGRASISEIS